MAADIEKYEATPQQERRQ